MDKQPEGMIHDHQGGAEVIIVSLLKAVYPLKYPRNACLSYLDNDLGVLPVRLLFTGIFYK